MRIRLSLYLTCVIVFVIRLAVDMPPMKNDSSWFDLNATGISLYQYVNLMGTVLCIWAFTALTIQEWRNDA